MVMNQEIYNASANGMISIETSRGIAINDAMLRQSRGQN